MYSELLFDHANKTNVIEEDYGGKNTVERIEGYIYILTKRDSICFLVKLMH